ncbi:uncharacterized protein VTP21DRAFT_3066 [Calcarisporiella thermophila]|uniref:uncharacterized protein n=1 Tax=Calcarisporiella thermophila TaxID=911321 RepID=UPI0037435F6F
MHAKVPTLILVNRDYSSTGDDQFPWDFETAENWRRNFTRDKIPRVSTKVDVRFLLDEAQWIPKYAREKLKEISHNRINKKGEFVMTSDRTRSQAQNLEDCINKLHDEVLQAVEVPREPDEETLKRIQRL